MTVNKDNKENNFLVYFLSLLLFFCVCSDLKNQNSLGELEQKYESLKKEKHDLVVVLNERYVFLKKENHYLRRELSFQKNRCHHLPFSGCCEDSLSFPLSLPRDIEK